MKGVTDTTDRLKVSASVLATIDQRREQMQDPNLGAGVERYIIRRELRELEREILVNPGPLQTLLVRAKGQF